MTPEQELSYVASFIDGEGYVLYRRTANASKLHRRIGFTNTDKELFDTVAGMLNRAGFLLAVRERRMKNPKHSTRWDCYLLGGRGTFERFLSLVPLQHSGKLQRLREIVNGYMSLDDAKRKRAEAWRSSVSPERQREIAQKARNSRWGDHVPTKPRVRLLTREQKDRKNLLKRMRRLSSIDTRTIGSRHR